MYNDIILIVVCIFAVYGAYSFAREIAMIFFKKSCAAAVHIDSKMQSNEISDAILEAERYTSQYSFLEREIVLLCEEDMALEKYGYRIYKRWRRNDREAK